MATPTQVLRADLDSALARISVLEEKFGSLTVSKSPERSIIQPAQEQELPEAVLKELGASDPIPRLYREEVSRILNASFGIHMKGAGDAAAFQFTIIVPEKYSSLTPEQKAMNVPDIRVKVIEYALGLNGVKEWSEMVYKNFSNETQAIITADRLHTL